MSIVSKVIDDSCIQYKIQRVKKVVQNSAPQALKKGFVTYAEVASRQMPPPKEGKKSRSIPAKLYKRNILPISKAIKTDKKTKSSSQQKSGRDIGLQYMAISREESAPSGGMLQL